ncbi:Dynamin-related protein 3B [Symbiodinium microadriaticum]|uniref:Dynamin-related protein 3B n=1 Tax=Symbiodinium microadriaticum TaxID=2951 RepID=A0A1Q9ES79_SYMMI|nr:Dynamin-related protein 3B [Symbiodinium microadriaticum]
MNVLRGFHEGLVAAKDAALRASPESASSALTPMEPQEAVGLQEVPSMKDPLAVLNAIHQVLVSAGLHAELSLPTIAVVGSQSVGKTSVLESLVGAGHSEWAEFQHNNRRFSDFGDVRREIEAETARVCGGSRSVSDEPILLRIFSPAVMDLTLVDLPVRQRDLVKKYVASSNTLILAVSAANVDLATSDALALAREVVGVLTKLDLAEEQSTAFEALAGEVYPLRLGYTAVVCRNDKSSQAGMTFEDALKEEHDFFTRQQRFQPLLSQCGIPNLAQRLQFLLLNHIREALPSLRTNVQQVAGKCREELATLGDENLEKQMGQGPLLLHLISCYVRHFGDLLEGRVEHRLQVLPSMEIRELLQEPPPAKLVGGARIHHIFHRVFAQEILQFDAFTGLSDMDIRVAMRNAAGPKPLFVPEIAFERMVKRQIQKLEDPALQCVALVFEELQKELKQLASQSGLGCGQALLQGEVGDLQRFPGLREKVLEVSNLIRIEREFINDVIRLPPVPLVVTPAGEPSEKERMDTELLKQLGEAIRVRKIIDSVPKAIMHFMVNSVQETLHAECISVAWLNLDIPKRAQWVQSELYKPDLIPHLLQEPEAKLAELQKAQDLLAQICDAAAGCA